MASLLGLAVGVALSAITAVKAGSIWMNPDRLGDSEREFKLGYVAGVFDTGRFASYKDVGVNTQYFQRKMDCLDGHGDTLGQFLNWAEQKWAAHRLEDGGENAATLIMTEACEP